MQTEIDDPVALVRRFNRTVTQRVGALQDRYLARDRPLGEARVLWESARPAATCGPARLDLDSGYLSRLLRSLEAAGLVLVGPGDGDRRVRAARLTTAGRAERRVLDERSEALAAGMLALSPAQRDHLVAAMGDVERLLTAALVDVEPADPAHPDARRCLAAYMAELDRRFAGGFGAARSLPLDRDELVPPAGVFLGPAAGRAHRLRGLQAPARRGRVPQADVGGARRRGLGLGRRLLAELEDHARAAGAALAQQANGTLTEAIALYTSAGYAEVPPFNDDLRPLVRQAPLTADRRVRNARSTRACASPRR